MCSVLRCSQVSAHVFDYSADPEAPAFETLLCDHHKQLIDAGAAWRWDDDERCILMGDDLDSDGSLILEGWSFTETIGPNSVLSLDCTTPSGKPHEPVKFIITRDELEEFLSGFRMMFPLDVGEPDPDDDTTTQADIP